MVYARMIQPLNKTLLVVGKISPFLTFQPFVVLSTNQCAVLFRIKMTLLIGRDIGEVLRPRQRDQLLTTLPEVVGTYFCCNYCYYSILHRYCRKVLQLIVYNKK